jgi:holo-[acyl-carrier protein] synthase
METYTRGFKHIIVLPVVAPDHMEHQSSRPQALVLNTPLLDTKGSDEAAPRPTFDLEALDGQMCEISITHDGDFASAVALVPSMKQDGPP